jgi:uncharacterized protein YutE (UPF0331/DUF86 family)
VTLEVVIAKLGELASRLAMVRKHRKASAAEYASDPEAQDLVAFNLMLAVQCAADLATHIVTSEGFVPARTVSDAFERLAEHGIIARSLFPTLRRAVGFRNVVAHGYVKLDREGLVQAAHEGVEDLGAFAQQLAQWAKGRYPATE